MFKRSKGYFLLTMLVLTGFAGQVHTDTLTTKERRHLFTELKSSRAELIKSIEGLTDDQLNFTAGGKQPSVRDCIDNLVTTEKKLWMIAKAALKSESDAEERLPDDQSLPSLAYQRGVHSFPRLKFKNVKEALKLHKNDRQEMQKYVNTTTANVRAHVAKTEFGTLDVYQVMLLNSMLCRQYTQKISQLKTSPDFPK